MNTSLNATASFPYGQTIRCACGKTHVIDPRKIIYSSDAIGQISDTAAEYCTSRTAVVLMDERTRVAAGEEVADAMSAGRWSVTTIVIPDVARGQGPVCDDSTYASIKDFCGRAGVVVAVGSGVISDLGKWAAFEFNRASICFATAASMNGYSSANVAATRNGVKTVVRARPPKAVFSSPDVLCNAPYSMTASGLGDVLAKSVSSADWRMNRILFNDYYCERSASLIAEIEPMVMKEPEKLARHDADAVEKLFQALLLTGAAMTMAESSAPASGGEHLVSHALDMMSQLDGVAHDLHGRQVGVGTILASEVYRRVMEIESPVTAEVESDIGFWGVLGAEVEEYFRGKSARINDASRYICSAGNWDKLREALAGYLRPASHISGCLRKANAAHCAADIGCSRERLHAALIHAHEIRSRFTILDLAWLTGVLPGQAGEIIETAESL